MNILSVTSVWPYFAVTAILLLAGALLARVVPFYRGELAGQDSGARAHAIDGLRGYLAFGVFFMHASITHAYYQTGIWEVPPSAFYTVIGQLGVATFFAITAFLFWSKLLRGPLEPRSFFLGRIRRLAPMYFASILAVFAIVAVRTGFSLQVRLGDLATEVLAWLSFGFMIPPDINGLPNTLVINSVLWTLSYEWGFYLMLPALALFARGRGFLLVVALVALFGVKLNGHDVLLDFVAGALAAHAVASGRWREAMRSPWAAALSLAAVVTLFVCFDQAYGVYQSVLVLVFFLPIAFGNTLFGLLRLRSAHLLGLVSYSVYLTHSLVLYVVFGAIDRVTPVAELSPLAFWGATTLCGLLVVGVSAITYRAIEHAFMVWRPVPADRVAAARS